MNKTYRHILSAIACTAFFVVSNAQDSVETPPVEAVPDTNVYENITVSSGTNYHFREVTGAGKVNTRKVSDEELNKVKSDDDYWYVNQKPDGKKGPAEPQSSGSKKGQRVEEKKSIAESLWSSIAFWIILIAAFVGLLVWFLATSNIRLFRKASKPIEEEAEEQATEDIYEMNFEKEIQKAIDGKNYRMAIRLMYLRTLRDLSLRKLITYTHEKTNSDYLFQLAGTNYYKNFFRLTRNFDYTWYGQFEVSQDSFGMIQNDFSSFKQQLS
jgi:hypothetical protein